MRNYSGEINIFFRAEMCDVEIEGSRSKSPLKSKFLVEKISKSNFKENFKIENSFSKFEKTDFLIAHTEDYVNGFFKGDYDYVADINIPWSVQLCENVCWTNSSLYNAIKHSILNPKTISLSPTSGFHHSTPERGYDFCSFSGQVIASIKIYEEYGLKGCYIDLDAHYGNSIEDSRVYVKNLNYAIPKGFNINPIGIGESYIKNLKKEIKKLKKAILEGRIDYVVFCHGADSHIEDDLDCGSLSTEQWLRCSDIVYDMIEDVSDTLGRNIPLILSLFGGYRNDNFDFVVDLHLQSIVKSLK